MTKSTAVSLASCLYEKIWKTPDKQKSVPIFWTVIVIHLLKYYTYGVIYKGKMERKNFKRCPSRAQHDHVETLWTKVPRCNQVYTVFTVNRIFVERFPGFTCKRTRFHLGSSKSPTIHCPVRYAAYLKVLREKTPHRQTAFSTTRQGGHQNRHRSNKRPSVGKVTKASNSTRDRGTSRKNVRLMLSRGCSLDRQERSPDILDANEHDSFASIKRTILPDLFKH